MSFTTLLCTIPNLLSRTFEACAGIPSSLRLNFPADSLEVGSSIEKDTGTLFLVRRFLFRLEGFGSLRTCEGIIL
jgi:hypothetical protein